MTAYSDLQADVTKFAFRNGDEEFEGAVKRFIQLGEAALNRELSLLQQETDVPLTGSVGSRFLTLPTDFVEPISLHLLTGGGYQELRPDVAGEMPLQQSNGWPSAWAINGSNIQIDTPCDQVHSFTFRYRGKFALSDDKPTNWLIENHYDVYLAAAMGWGAAFMRDDPELAKWKALAQEAVDSVGWQASRSRLTTMVVDDALLGRGRFNIITG
jgi:hypothetical protein